MNKQLTGKNWTKHIKLGVRASETHEQTVNLQEQTPEETLSRQETDKVRETRKKAFENLSKL